MDRLSYCRAAARAALPLLGLLLPAFAGDYFETDGVALAGYDAVSYQRDNAAVRGRAEFSATHKGSAFHFSSAEHRDAFRADPERYAPRYLGYCAYGASKGYKAITSPQHYSVVEGRLYLNYNGEVQAMWSKDVRGFIDRADAAWPAVSATSKVLR